MGFIEKTLLEVVRRFARFRTGRLFRLGRMSCGKTWVSLAVIEEMRKEYDKAFEEQKGDGTN